MTITITKAKEEQSFLEIKNKKERLLLDVLEHVTIDEMATQWLNGLSKSTKISYTSGLKFLQKEGFYNPSMTMIQFSQLNHETIVDSIKMLTGISEASRQARAALYISLTGFLARRFPGICVKAVPNKEGASKTFYKVNDKVITKAMTKEQWNAFLDALKYIDSTHYTIAKVILQGAKRVSEVLLAKKDQINWEKCEITFKQSKVKVHKKTVITYSKSLMNEIKKQLNPNSEYIFSQHSGEPFSNHHLQYTFMKAGKKAHMPFRVHPHMLRASAVTHLKKQGFHVEEIQKITGHASIEQVNAYDKNELADNVSKKINLAT